MIIIFILLSAIPLGLLIQSKRMQYRPQKYSDNDGLGWFIVDLILIGFLILTWSIYFLIY